MERSSLTWILTWSLHPPRPASVRVPAPWPVVFGVGVVALLVAAKSHGRQVRLVREAAGFRDVAFGGVNAPFVVALWRRDRVRFWSVFLVVVVGIVVGSRGRVVLLAPLWAGVAAFVAAGLSHPRRGGNVGWWLATAVTVVAFGVATAWP